jgi:hypothetical protein
MMAKLWRVRFTQVLVVGSATNEPGEECDAFRCGGCRCAARRHIARVHLVENRASIRIDRRVVDVSSLGI